MTAKVDARSGAVSAMESDWRVAEALLGGTLAMRAAGEAFLPKWPAEEPEAYRSRCGTATLFPAFRRTISVMTGKPFSKALTLDDNTPALIAEWADDIDREGVSLNVFAAEMFGEGLAYGLAGILVEAPKPTETGARVQTRAEQQAAGLRPYFVRVKHGQILGWRVSIIDGSRRLTQLRLSEDTPEPEGEFGEVIKKRVRVLTPGQWAVYERAADKDEWTIIEEGLTGLAYIPFVPVYGRRRGFMDGVSPLADLAHLNVKHWQSQSDQDTILHVARVPILAISGGNESTKLTVGGSSAVMLPQGGEMKWVEHSGAAIEAGQTSLEALESQMIQAGAELLVKKPGDRSATEAANDAEGNKSDLQRMTEDFEDSLDQALQMMADYAGLGPSGSVSLFKDFGASNLSEASGQLVLAMVEAGMLSKETGLAEMKRRGEVAAEVEFDDEMEKIGNEEPDLHDEGEEAAAMAPRTPRPGTSLTA